MNAFDDALSAARALAATDRHYGTSSTRRASAVLAAHINNIIGAQRANQVFVRESGELTGESERALNDCQTGLDELTQLMQALGGGS